MVILGLGSNLDDRLANLRSALTYLKQLPNFLIEKISPIYMSDALVPDGAPASWDRPYFNLAMRCTTTLAPYELLKHLKEIERKVGRTPEKVWGPRIIDIDLLAWDDQVIYDEILHIPHEHLSERPFALWPLADVAPFWRHPNLNKFAAELVEQWGSRFSGEAPFHTQQISQRIDTPELMGIINVTPDSFSDEGAFLADPTFAVKKMQHMMSAGASIIDIGAEATNPKATAISQTEEWTRLEPVLTAMLAAKSTCIIEPKISIDTRNTETAKRALELGVDWINDVSGLQDKKMRQVIANSNCKTIVMHHLGLPVLPKNILPLNKNPVDLLLAWMESRLNDLLQDGINPANLIFDMGIGFGKNAAQNIEIVNQITEFQKFGVPLLVGHSRKIFLGQFTEKKFAERDLETTVLSLFLANKNIDYLRVHDVEMHARAFRLMRTFE